MHLTLLRHLALGLAFLPPTAALAQDYSFSFLASEGSIYRYANDLNNRGRATGVEGHRFWPRAVVWNTTRPLQQPSGLAYLAPCCGYRTSAGFAINDLGQVVGEETGRAALWNPDSPRPVLLAGESQAHHATDLNNAGTVVGHRDIYDTPGALRTRAVIWDSAGLRDLATFGGPLSQASAINEAGTVAGMSANAAGEWRATLWQGSTMVDLGAGWAYDLNDRGQAVGTSGDRAVLWNGTQATFLDDTEGSIAVDINDRGWAVGSVIDDAATLTTRAMLWHDGQAIDLNSFLGRAERDAGWRLGSAVAINDHGWILGTAYDPYGAGSAYILSIPAIPEPASIAMLLAGLGVIGVAARGRTQRERSRRNGLSTA